MKRRSAVLGASIVLIVIIVIWIGWRFVFANKVIGEQSHQATFIFPEQQIQEMFPGIGKIDFEGYRWSETDDRVFFRTVSTYHEIKNIEWSTDSQGNDLQLIRVKTFDYRVATLDGDALDCSRFTVFDECYQVLEQLLSGSFVLSAEIAESDEAIDLYLQKTLHYVSSADDGVSGFVKHIWRGKFDRNREDTDMIVISYDRPGGVWSDSFDGLLFFYKDLKAGDWLGSFYAMPSSKQSSIRFEEIMKEEPPFLIMESTGWSGASPVEGTDTTIYSFQSGYLRPVFEANTHYYRGPIATGGRFYGLDYGILFTDTNDDGVNELVLEGDILICQEQVSLDDKYGCKTPIQKKHYKRIYFWNSGGGIFEDEMLFPPFRLF